MHRPSAAENPTAPLGHHERDATHITHGVVTAGIGRGPLTLEGSWFRGGRLLSRVPALAAEQDGRAHALIEHAGAWRWFPDGGLKKHGTPTL